MIKAVVMGFSRKRRGRDGRPRYTAYYLNLRGRERSAGTFATKKAANDAWKEAESGVRAGKQGDSSRGRQIRNHLLPFFGPMRMRDIMPEHVRHWVTHMQGKNAGVRTIQYCKTSILNAIFTTALEDEVVAIHPSRGVKTPAVPAKPRRIITADQFGVLHEALPEEFRLLVETDIESGLRWGELTELRPRDLEPATWILTVSRAVVEISPAEHPEGGRFLVKDYPKDKEYRRFKLSAQITAKLIDHAAAAGLGRDDLLFSYRPRARTAARPPAPDGHAGMTEPDGNGHSYRHGTLTAYNAARCRCALPGRLRALPRGPPRRGPGQPDRTAGQGH
jgi:integrase